MILVIVKGIQTYKKIDSMAKLLFSLNYVHCDCFCCSLPTYHLFLFNVMTKFTTSKQLEGRNINVCIKPN